MLSMTMLRHRLHRLGTVLFAVLSLLFSQLALASYVCPQQARVEHMAAMMEAGVPCEGMDQDQPVLCHQHAADPGKTFEAAKLPSVPAPAIVQVLELPLVIDAMQPCAAAPAAHAEARPPPDPLFLATRRLRI